MANPKKLPCPICRKSDNLAVYRYDHGWQHVECDRCMYMGPGEGSARDAIRSHNRAVRDEAAALIRKHWDNYTDCKPVPDDFLERIEAAGMAEFRRVTRRDLQQTGAEDRGIEKGGMCWSLTAAGEAAISATPN